MPRKLKLPGSRREIFIYDEDWAFLLGRFGPTGVVNYGVGPVIRDLVHKQVRRLRQAEVDRQDQKEEKG